MTNFNALLRGLLWVLLSIGLLPAAQAQIILPVEVLGPQGTTVQVTLPVADASKVAALYLRVHRPGFRGASTDPATARASVRINGGTWVDVTNANCQAWPVDASYGGIGGGFQTVRFKIAASKFGAAFAASNTLSIRLNQTDGHSSGLRVLEVNLLDAGGAKLMPASAFAQDDPTKWTAPRPGAADIAEGKRLWKEAVLVESPLASTALRAKCSSCHHENGADLKYFRYSNKSIIERTKFHGLSQAQGEQIASYIRSLTLKKRDGSTYNAPGYPWDPPYQPGPGLDSKPVEEWSAGAGLNAVLEKDSDMLPYLFPNGTSLAEMKKVTSTKATLNMRELPNAVQFLDWNEWLSPLHPVDIWGDEFYNSAAWKSYQRVRQELAPNGRASVSPARVADLMKFFTGDGITQTLHRDNLGDNLPAGVSFEQAQVGLRRWVITKIWELNHDFYLEDFAPQVHPHGERGWLGRERSVFELAPHLSAGNGEHFAYQNKLVGKYFSTVWYQTQLVVNPGYRTNAVHIPVDWKYHLSHIENLSGMSAQTPGEGLRYVSSLIKDMQMWDNEVGVSNAQTGWNLREIWPETLASDNFDKVFSSLTPALRRDLAEAVYSAWYEKTASHPIADFDRFGYSNGQVQNFNSYSWNPSNYPFTALDEPDNLRGTAEMPIRVRNMIIFGRELGINGTLLNQIADFGEAMWPLWDFDQLKGAAGPTSPPATQAPYGNTARALPGTIQAEDYDTGGEGVAYHDDDTNNRGGAYRTSEGVDVQTTTDTNGGHNVGYANDGEWLEYTVNVTGGTQDVQLRVASVNTGRQIRVKLGSTTLGTVTVPNTGAWQTWQTVTLAGVSVPGGTGQVLRLEFVGGGVNLNWIRFGAGTPPAATGLANGLYTLTPECAPANRLDVAGAATAGGTKVQTWTANSHDAQNWLVERQPDGSYRLSSELDPDMVLDVAGMGTANGTQMHLWEWLNNDAQKFTLTDMGGGSYRLEPKCAPGKAVDVSGSSTAAGAKVQLWDANTSGAQKWKFTLLSATASRTAASSAASATPTSDAASLTAFPNPSVDGQATLRLEARQPHTATVYVRNDQGQLVSVLAVPVKAGRTDFRLPSVLAKGTYFVQTKLDGQPRRFVLRVE
ncbi:RICIN domain-containing protein [Hymenobacter weizhouensis]|uniref:RICIN domain-containing protein n=1 Tax=Hymenobacter sp. YIM 151500-1 TaxID=2987689 RepID=UPI002227E8DE|nr:RICIN domain-containing protein [Hymenobacter sp. YIM 151500-1]UYZ64944.1 RICIN domain-containing protein [Hymenobacter sp. YIM 151500-1]